MDLLRTLGVNSTLALQFVIFIVTFLIMKIVLFKPYFEAFNKRNERTIGQTEQAEKYLEESRKLEDEYAAKAKEVNERYRKIYDQTRVEANKEHERLVSEARARSKQLMDQSRTQIETQVQAVKAQIAQEVNNVSQLINHKLIGKDLQA
jgi:F0F1-type ATP synthase membrane subunit b/b'